MRCYDLIPIFLVADANINGLPRDGIGTALDRAKQRHWRRDVTYLQHVHVVQSSSTGWNLKYVK